MIGRRRYRVFARCVALPAAWRAFGIPYCCESRGFRHEFEYSDRLAKLHERERLESYEQYEEDEGEPFTGRRDREDRD